MKMLIVGCGYLGKRVAKRWLEAGHDVWALTRNAQKAGELRSVGIQCCIGDVTDASSLKGLPAADVAMFAVGFQAGSDYSRMTLHRIGLQNMINAMPTENALGRLIYISSTGVYGPMSGAEVDENTPCHPEREGGRACLEAERYLTSDDCPYADRSLILRLAGIYGPGRVPQRRALERGELSVSPLDAYLNLIHVDDAARCVTVAAERAPLPSLYLVSDGSPVRRRDYYREVLLRMGKSEDVVEGMMAQFQVRTDSRGRGDKRVSNAKLIRELGMELAYPSYREGLAASMDNN